MSDLDVGRLADGEAGGGGGQGEEKVGCTFGWRWIILFSGWFSFAFFSATLYTSGKYQSTVSNYHQIVLTFYITIGETSDQCDVHCAGLFFVIYLNEFGEARSRTAWVGQVFRKHFLVSPGRFFKN